MNFRTSIFATVILLIAAGQNHSLCQVISGSGKTDQIRTSTAFVIKILGWRVPDSKGGSAIKKSVVRIDGFDIDAESFVPRESVVDYEGYFLDSQNQLTIVSARRRIVTVTVYSYRQQKYAYAVRYESYRGLSASVGGLYEVRYVDADGDGLFEQRLETTRSTPIPDWIKTRMSSERGGIEEHLNLLFFESALPFDTLGLSSYKQTKVLSRSGIDFR